MFVTGVCCWSIIGAIQAEVRIEFTARTVASAAPKWLGNMVKAVPPIGVDVLLRTVGVVKRGVGGS